MGPYILGISGLYHNSAAALVSGGEIVAAAEEERFTRKKGDASFPLNAILYCLDSAGITPADLTAAAFYENVGAKFQRILTGIFLTAPKSLPQFLTAMPDWATNKLWIENRFRREFGAPVPFYYVPHHLAHAASAYYPSPFSDAAVLTVDGVGEWSTLTLGDAQNGKLRITRTLDYPNSLGLLYSAFTLYTGFRINNGEYKMMGLAPYGKPVYADLIKKELVHIADDGSFALNQKYFSYTYGLKTFNAAFEALFGRKKRGAKEPPEPFHADVAASIQAVTNEILLKLAKTVRAETGRRRLVMAGGVALNVTANGALRASGIFDGIWIQPAAGDAGGALGAALSTCYQLTGDGKAEAERDFMKNAYLGLNIAEGSRADDAALKKLGAEWTVQKPKTLINLAAERLSAGKIVAIARGRAEFGPRALGNRSIFADARDPAMLQRLNRSIKFREGFRPFAPIVLREDAAEYFDTDGDSPYMLFTFPVKEARRLPLRTADSVEKTAALARSDIPSVTHVDYSARIQSLEPENNPFVADLLREFRRLTGCGVLINTSFNTNEEPIVNTAADAFRCFMRSGIDCLIVGDRWFEKEKQTAAAPKGGW